ncbi:MAG: hypothetical protein NC253_05060, partial [Ruminococcus sp.]|nr:hypothetical protein [Ruminococcus sp.]
RSFGRGVSPPAGGDEGSAQTPLTAFLTHAALKGWRTFCLPKGFLVRYYKLWAANAVVYAK